MWILNATPKAPKWVVDWRAATALARIRKKSFMFGRTTFGLGACLRFYTTFICFLRLDSEGGGVQGRRFMFFTYFPSLSLSHSLTLCRKINIDWLALQTPKYFSAFIVYIVYES